MSFLEWAPGAALLASVAGSGHCVAMCGGLSLALAPGRNAQVRYHLGRGVAYVLLGGAAGALGETLLASAANVWLSFLAAVLLGLGILLTGVQVWRKQSFHLSLVPRPLLLWLHRASHGHAFAGGVLTAFLPCGWLHGFLLAAAATRDPLAGAILTAAFWLGTVPALSGAGWILRGLASNWGQKIPRLAALVLIAVGIFGIGQKLSGVSAHAEVGEARGAELRCH